MPNWSAPYSPDPDDLVAYLYQAANASAWGGSGGPEERPVSRQKLREAAARIAADKERIAELEHAAKANQPCNLGCETAEEHELRSAAVTSLDLPDLVRPKGAWHEAADTLAAMADERKDWARRFKLNGVTPWDWMTRAQEAEDDRERLTDNVCAVVQENEQLRINAERAEAEVARLTQIVRQGMEMNRQQYAENAKLRRAVEAGKAMRNRGVNLAQTIVDPSCNGPDDPVGDFVEMFDGPLQREFDAAVADLEKP